MFYGIYMHEDIAFRQNFVKHITTYYDTENEQN